MGRHNLRIVIRRCAVRLVGEARVRVVAAWVRNRGALLRGQDGRPPPVRFMPMAELTRRRVTLDGLVARRSRSPAICEVVPAEDHAADSLRVPSGSGAGGMVRLQAAPQHYRSEARLLARLPDALVWPAHGLVMAKPGQVIAETAVSIRWGRPLLQDVPGFFQSDGKTFLQRDGVGEPRTLDGPMLLFCHSSHWIYGHWLMDCLPGVVALRDGLRAGRLAAMAPPLRDWQRECLARIGVAPAIHEIPDQVVRVRDLIIASFLDIRDVDTPSRAARDTFAAIAAGATPAPGAARLLYVSRRGAERRRMSNEAELEAALAALGFVAIRPETLSIGDQIAAFASARVVVGAHGSGMANIGFAPPGCIVAEIMPSGFRGSWIERLAAVLGHTYVGIEASTDDGPIEIDRHGGKRIRTDWTYAVAVPEMVSAVTAALALA